MNSVTWQGDGVRSDIAYPVHFVLTHQYRLGQVVLPFGEYGFSESGVRFFDYFGECGSPKAGVRSIGPACF